MHEEFLKEWFGIHAGRELGSPERFFVEKPEDLIDFVQKCRAEHAPCYMSVQPYSRRDQVYGLEKLFFDFDCKEDTSLAWRDAATFAENLIEFYRVLPFITFSGGKGYHVYVFLKNTVVFPLHRTEFVKHVYERLQRKLLKGLKFETLDQSVIGDLKRLARVPYSIHEKTEKTCHPISLQHQFIDPRSLEVYRLYGLDTGLIQDICGELKLEEKLKEFLTREKKSIRIFKTGKVRPCIQEALKQPLEDKEGHLMRLAIAVEFLNKGYSVDQVVDLFRAQGDFSERKTRYYVEDAKRKGYKPFRCSKIRELGFCLGDSCMLQKRRAAGLNQSTEGT